MPKLQDAFGGADAQYPGTQVSVDTACRLGMKWWDRTGRHVVRNPEFQNPDIGYPSGILRGLEFQYLSVAEQVKVVAQYIDKVFRPGIAAGKTLQQIEAESYAGRAKIAPRS